MAELTPQQIQQVKETVILVADDDAMVREIIVEHLKIVGFIRVLEAKNGSLALKIIQDSKQQIDIVVSDWEMPIMDGFSLLKSIRQNPQRAKLKFIMVTSQVSRERIKISQAMQYSVDGYIVKPFRQETLRAKIFELLGLPFEPESGSEAS